LRPSYLLAFWKLWQGLLFIQSENLHRAFYGSCSAP
jgi:hypothetical protein